MSSNLEDRYYRGEWCFLPSSRSCAGCEKFVMKRSVSMSRGWLHGETEYHYYWVCEAKDWNCPKALLK